MNRLFDRLAAWMPLFGLTLSVVGALILTCRAIWGPVGFERRALLRADLTIRKK